MTAPSTRPAIISYSAAPSSSGHDEILMMNQSMQQVGLRENGNADADGGTVVEEELIIPNQTMTEIQPSADQPGPEEGSSSTTMSCPTTTPSPVNPIRNRAAPRLQRRNAFRLLPPDTLFDDDNDDDDDSLFGEGDNDHSTRRNNGEYEYEHLRRWYLGENYREELARIRDHHLMDEAELVDLLLRRQRNARSRRGRRAIPTTTGRREVLLSGTISFMNRSRVHGNNRHDGNRSNGRNGHVARE